uniref:RNA-directed RNA polymerase n=1 Tax=Wenling scaldfish reovirus TaxID=2116342 RepID=A0A2P1GNR3_9REOV|nr:RNA-dependent RNA polymerase [Wenling scaldfish reovirus]
MSLRKAFSDLEERYELALNDVINTSIAVTHDEKFRIGDAFKLYESRIVGEGESIWMNTLESMKVRPLTVEYYKLLDLKDLDEFDPMEKFLRNYKVDEDHEFDEFISWRAQREMNPYGVVTQLTWWRFLTRIHGKEDWSSRAIGRIVKDYGTPFIQKKTDKSELTGQVITYSIASIIELHLNSMLLRYQYKRVEAKFRIFMKEEEILKIVNAWKKRGNEQYNLILRKEIIRDERGETRYVLDLTADEIIKQYERILISGPKKRNGEMRNGMTWMVKQWSVMVPISKIITYEGKKVYDKASSTRMRYGKIKYVRNKNAEMNGFEERRREIIDTRGEMDEAGHVGIFSLLVDLCLWLDFDPEDKNHIGILTVLLSIPLLGGYGRSMKKASAPETVKMDINYDMHNQQFYRNLMRYFREAKDIGITNIPDNEWRRGLVSLLKSTSSGESRKVTVSDPATRKDVEIKVTTKGVVGLMMGEKALEQQEDNGVVERFLKTGSRDVPVKASRLVYPVPIPTLLKQYLVSAPFIHYSTMDVGTRTFDTEYLSGVIATGSGESIGSRLVDDTWVIEQSGDEELLVITYDLSAFDAHCNWDSYRKTLLQALHDWYKDSKIEYEGRRIYDLVDEAYSVGFMHKTFWDSGRRIFKGKQGVMSSKSERRKAQTEIESKEGNEWIKRLEKPRGTFMKMSDDVEDENGDMLFFNADGSDLTYLESQGSGEITTLLWNSVLNYTIAEDLKERLYTDMRIKMTTVSIVGDDCIMSGYSRDNKINYKDVKAKIVDIITQHGHSVNPIKTGVAFLNSEYRQTHAKNGAYIPKDQIMITSSERPKKIEDVKGAIKSYKALILTKLSRGMSDESAWDIFMIYAASLLYGMLRFHKIDGNEIVRKTYEEKSDGKVLTYSYGFQTLIVPDEYGGMGISPNSLINTMTVGRWKKCINDGDINKNVADQAKRITEALGFWKTEVDTSGTRGTYEKYADKEFLTKLVGSERMKMSKLLEARTSGGVKLGRLSPENLPHKIFSESLTLEGTFTRLRRRDDDGRFLEKLRMIINDEDISVSADYSADMVVDNVEFVVGERLNEGGVPMDPFVDETLKILREQFGYNDGKRTVGGFSDRLRIILASDPLMRGIVSSDDLLTVMKKNGVSPIANETLFKLMMYIVGFSTNTIERVTKLIRSEMQYATLSEFSRYGILSDEYSLTLGELIKGGEDVFDDPVTRSEGRYIMLMCKERMVEGAIRGAEIKEIVQVKFAGTDTERKLNRKRFRDRTKLRLKGKVQSVFDEIREFV